ncbi:MAG: GNAT family N-acetyltransferase [Propionibacteriaceae bacterium]
MDFEVRPADPAEYAAVGALTAEGYLADDLLAWENAGEHDYEGELRAAAVRATGAELWVAADARDLLGTVTWCPPPSPLRELSTSDDQGEFRMLAVSPTARRRGVARALVTACLDRARAAQMREVLLCSLPTMTKAHALYRSFGFERSPELDWSPVPGVDLWGFRLTLPG